MKIRARVTLWYAAILTVSLLIMGAGTYQEISEQLHHDHSARVWQHALDETSEMVFDVGLPAIILGLLGGFGFWAFPLIVVYQIPIGAYTLASLWHAPRRLAAALLLSAVGFAVGAAPWIWYTATHGLIIEALQEAGLPKGVVNFVTNAPADAAAVVEAMVAHPAVRRVNFTGSTHVGKLIAATCAKYLKPVVLELGGKAPLVILDDADVDAAVNAAVFGAFANSGQICMSTERIVVDEKVADEFVKKFAEKARSLPHGTGRISSGACIR